MDYFLVRAAGEMGCLAREIKIVGQNKEGYYSVSMNLGVK